MSNAMDIARKKPLHGKIRYMSLLKTSKIILIKLSEYSNTQSIHNQKYRFLRYMINLEAA